MNEIKEPRAAAAPRSAVGKAEARIKAVTSAAAHEADQAAEAKPRVIGPVMPATLMLEQYRNNSWVAIAPRDCVPEDFHLRSEPFDLLPSQMARFDTLRLIDPGDRWLAQYLCVESVLMRKVFSLMSVVKLPAREGDMTDRVPTGYEVVQGGPDDFEDWKVVRVKDGVVLNKHQRMGSREEAVRYCIDHPTVRPAQHHSIY